MMNVVFVTNAMFGSQMLYRFQHFDLRLYEIYF